MSSNIDNDTTEINYFIIGEEFRPSLKLLATSSSLIYQVNISLAEIKLVFHDIFNYSIYSKTLAIYGFMADCHV